jgi:hypothetical protein
MESLARIDLVIAFSIAGPGETREAGALHHFLLFFRT